MWKREFLSLLSGETIDREKISKALALKNKNLPNKIYKFRAVSRFSLDNLKTDTVWMTSADKFNDPYDCATSFQVNTMMDHAFIQDFDGIVENSNLQDVFSPEQINAIKIADNPMRSLAEAVVRNDESIPEGKEETFINIILGVAGDSIGRIVEETNKHMQRGMKICSFSSRNDSIVMWGHYADSHKGYCVEYDIGSLPESADHRTILYPVIYSDEVFDTTKYFRQAFKDKNNFNNLHGVVAASYKSLDWSYEDEWRFIIALGGDDEWNYPMPRPSALYLGSRIEDGDKSTLIEIASKKDIPVYQMKLLIICLSVRFIDIVSINFLSFN